MNKKKTNFMRFLLTNDGGKKRFLIAAIGLSAIAVVFSFMAPQILRLIVDSVLGDEPFKVPSFVLNLIEQAGGRAVLRNHLLLCAGVGMVFTFASAGIDYLYKHCMNRYGESLVKNLRDMLYAHIQRLPYEWHVKVSTGDILQRCTADINVIKQFICSQLIEIIRTVYLAVFAFIVMFSMNTHLALIAMLFAPVIIGYTVIFLGKLNPRFMAADIAEGEVTTVVQENATGVRVVRAFGREAFEMTRFDRKNENFANIWIKLGKVLSIFWASGDIVTSTQIMTIIIAGTVQCLKGQMSVGTFLAFITYNQMMIWPVRNLGRVLSEASKTGVSVERVEDILRAVPEALEDEKLMPSFKGAIEFDNVSFAYEQVPVLKNISFTLEPGQKLGILGNTGSGKSTIAHLLNRLYDLKDNEGTIKIDGIDIREINREHLRKNVNVVLQETFLYSKTIFDNIAVTKANADYAQVRHAAGLASVDKSIMSFGRQYDTIVGERGITLSGGQKQRVAIARALLNPSPVIIFDDSMSALDTETEQKIRHALWETQKEMTTIYISHRITTLMEADKIIVLHDGEIKEAGDHQSLIAADGIYKRIYDMQANVNQELELLDREGADE